MFAVAWQRKECDIHPASLHGRVLAAIKMHKVFIVTCLFTVVVCDMAFSTRTISLI